MRRVPLLSGERVTVVEVPDDAIVLRPPRPRDRLDDVAAAVRDALRFPLDGQPLERLVTRGGTATVVIEQPSLPIPGAVSDPRHEALAATVDEFAQLGVTRVTILVAGGLQRRTTPREIGLLVPPEFRRRFRGQVLVHDAESDQLVDLGRIGGVPMRVNPALLETDVVVTVTAAETVLNGGPAALLRAAGTEALRTAGAVSLLETSAAQGWRTALALERALAVRVPVTGVSIVLNLPDLGGPLSGFPYEEEALDRLAASRLRRGLGLLPAFVRRRAIEAIPREVSAALAFGGVPSAAHAEALLRAIAFKGAPVEEPLDAIVIGIPPVTPFVPRERPNPLSAAYLGLGLALRLWRNALPLRDGGTAILLHPFSRTFPTPTQTPYRVLFDPRTARDVDALEEAERAAGADVRAIDAYRSGRACHPLEPFVEWSACEVAAARLGSVLIAGCRDAQAARQLGFVPVHNFATALGMARGAGAERIGFLLSPPYFPLLVSG
jgi:Lactate racemase N-terminal domain